MNNTWFDAENREWFAQKDYLIFYWQKQRYNIRSSDGKRLGAIGDSFSREAAQKKLDRYARKMKWTPGAQQPAPAEIETEEGRINER